MTQKQAINVEITYGDGPDILVCGDNFSILLMEDRSNKITKTYKSRYSVVLRIFVNKCLFVLGTVSTQSKPSQ